MHFSSKQDTQADAPACPVFTSESLAGMKTGGMLFTSE
jgi:hypothetical protein